MKKNSLTEAGQTHNSAQMESLIDAINQSFALFRRNYHNQYYKAFPDEKELNVTKRLWLDAMKGYSHEAILKAAKSVIETSEFLPTLHTMLKHCKLHVDNALPDAHKAYIEACQAPSPKAGYQWSHPAVYHAGKAADWFFLQNNPETSAFPVFKEKYEQICAQISAGKLFDAPSVPALPSDTHTPVSREESTKRISDLKKALDL